MSRAAGPLVVRDNEHGRSAGQPRKGLLLWLYRRAGTGLIDALTAVSDDQGDERNGPGHRLSRPRQSPGDKVTLGPHPIEGGLGGKEILREAEGRHTRCHVCSKSGCE
ncbi:hypothetical protein OHB07_38990 (plasmid) [Streptomyces sp. NBC_00111]